MNTWIPKFSCRSHSQNSSNLTDPRGRDFCVFATGVAASSFTYIAYGVAFQTSRIALCSGGVGATIWSPLLRIKSCSALKYNLEHEYIYMFTYVVHIYNECQYVTVIFSLQRSITNTINTISVAGNSTRILPDCVKTMQLFSRSQSWHISWSVFLYS